MRVLTTSGTLTKYHLTTVTAYVLPHPEKALPSSVDIYLGTDRLYANKANLDYSTCPFTVSYAASDKEVWGEQ